MVLASLPLPSVDPNDVNNRCNSKNIQPISFKLYMCSPSTRNTVFTAKQHSVLFFFTQIFKMQYLQKKLFACFKISYNGELSETT